MTIINRKADDFSWDEYQLDARESWMRATSLPERSDSCQIWETIPGFAGDKRGRLYKYWHYAFVVSVLLILLSVLILLNAYLHLVNISSYDINQEGASSPFLLTGYLGMFISIAILPVPDYILVPAYGYLSAIGLFNPYSTFLVCLLGALFPIEYACGRLAARPLTLKVLSLFRMSEKDIETADKWLVEHGKFSIFISTFIPFFYSLASLAAGTLKMSVAWFLLSSSAGFGLRFAFLEFVGYYTIYVFTASFDYSQRTLFTLLLILSSVYAVVHLVRTLARRRIK
jgi:membrane protein DedA with SNARE-associated domain